MRSAAEHEVEGLWLRSICEKFSLHRKGGGITEGKLGKESECRRQDIEED